MAAEMLRRQSDDSWPEQPVNLGTDDALNLETIGFSVPLRDAYRTAGAG